MDTHTYYWLGDRPAAPLILVPTRYAEPMDLAPYTGATAILRWPDGTTAAPAVALDAAAAELSVSMPAMDVVGLGWLAITLTGADTSDRIDAVPIIVQDDSDGWHTLPSARREWPDAARLADVRLFTILEVAKQQVQAYAPELPAGALPPINYRLAQIAHGRNILNAALVDPSGSSGDSDFQIAPHPLDWNIKQMLRPTRGVLGAR